MSVLELVFWIAVGLLVYTHLGYPLVLAALARGCDQRRYPRLSESLPAVSLIVAAHDEEDVIEAKVANALALDYPRERLELIVASDGSTDRTAERARAAGADLVLDLARIGKIEAQNAAVERAANGLLAFSDANASWAPTALRELVAPFADERVGYVCGQARFIDQGGSNQEGAYWRFELALRALESRLAGVTAGNGAIYAVRARGVPAARPRLQPRPLVPVRAHQARLAQRYTRRGRCRRRRWWRRSKASSRASGG